MCKKCYTNFIVNLRSLLKCGICGHTQKIEFHHIKPTAVNGMGRGWKRHQDIRNHPDCYIPLCYFCHKKVTSQEIDIRYNILNQLQWTTNFGHTERINVLR